MKIAVLGGGFTGLSAAYYLKQNNHQPTVFEKEKILGGLAAGFKAEGWDWWLEKTYHHLFANDGDILNFCKEIGFRKIFFKKPETASLYENSNHKLQITSESQTSNFKLQIFPLDTPVDLLKFPLLTLAEKIRVATVLGFLKLSPALPIFEQQTTIDFLDKAMGKRAAEILFGELFRKKFGKYAGKVLAAFIWARIKKRTKALGYVEGGFQTLINYLHRQLTNSRINVLTNYEVSKIEKHGDGFLVNGEEYEAIISTLPTPVLLKTASRVLPSEYLDRLQKINYLHAVTLILETDKPILKKTYWLNICTKEIPIMGIVQQTNYIDKKHYNNKHLVYCGWYVGFEDRLWKMEDKEILDFVAPYLSKIFNFQFPISKQVSNNQLPITNYFVFRAAFAQPIFDREFIKNKPDFITPVKNFYVANLDMTYPYDRGINYAIKLGKQVAKFI